MSDTYGGITRSTDPSAPYYSHNVGGHLTLKMLEDALVAVWRHDEETHRHREEFWGRIRKFNYLLDEKKYNVYLAAYRLTAASVYPDACLHPREFERYVKILAGEGISTF